MLRNQFNETVHFIYLSSSASGHNHLHIGAKGREGEPEVLVGDIDIHHKFGL